MHVTFTYIFKCQQRYVEVLYLAYFIWYSGILQVYPVVVMEEGWIFFKDFIYLFLERGREGEKEGEKYQCVVASRAPPTGDLAHNPGMCPDSELNRRLFGSQPALNPLSHTSQG